MPQVTARHADQTWLTHLDKAVSDATESVLADQQPDGHWCYELEADCTIPAEYIAYMHFMDQIDPGLERRMCRYLISRQNDDGSWPLYHAGVGDISCTVKAYLALKLAGQDPESSLMCKARTWILAAGGAERSNVFTRFLLAMFGQIPWRGVPCMPIEIMLLPGWFFFHLDRMSYWSRTVVVPLLVLYCLRAKASNPRQVSIPELFRTPPNEVRHWHPARSRLNRVFIALDHLVRVLEPWSPAWIRRRAMRTAETWFTQRLNGVDGLGAIFPAMINASIALKILGYADDHPLRLNAQAALERLLVEDGELAYCQPCLSPVWDTSLMALALQATQDKPALQAAGRGLDWLVDRQLVNEPGDWQRDRPGLPGGGWAFQYNNAWYPDLDDTAVVAWAMDQQDPQRYRKSIDLATNWLAIMQSTDGGFAAFDVDNTHYHLNEIPFADHGALLDPPTADVSARCLTLFARLNRDDLRLARQRVLDWLLEQQESDGSWFGRWGTNHVYGTWSTLVALCADPEWRSSSAVQRGVDWLKLVQRKDGGWGESNDSYADPALIGKADCSTSFQTAWALLGLIAAGEAHSEAAANGVDYLLRTQSDDGFWHEPWFTAPGFPRVFYLKYHGYSRYFPLWALAEFRSALKA